MNTFEAILSRRAVKHYVPDFIMPVPDEQKLFEMARNAPSSFNMQNWRFVVVRDKGIRKEIRQAAWDQAQVTEASLLIVLCADTRAWDKKPERYWENAPREVRDYLVPMVRPFYEGREQVQRDEAMRSVGIVAQTIMLSARAMGYDSCPMIGFDATAVAGLIHLPADHAIGMLLVVGKAAKPAQPKGGYLPLPEIIVEDRFN